MASDGASVGASSFRATPGDPSKETKTERQSRDLQVLWDLLSSYNKAYSLKAVVDLRIPDILNESGGSLTAGDIASKLSVPTVNVGYLSRIMTFAAVCGVFDLPPENGEGDPDVDGRKFALNAVSKMLVTQTSADAKVSMNHASNWMLEKFFIEPWKKLGEAVLTGTTPFEISWGMSIFEFAKKNSAWGESLHNLMASTSFLSEAMLPEINGLKGLKVVADVGGGLGALMGIVSRQYPGISCINFDLPHVVAQAPKIPGVKHVSGDMFESVPEADAIFLKRVLHNWSDEKCILILKNCWKALPKDGIVFIIDGILQSPTEAEPKDYSMEMIMLVLANGGVERTKRQWSKLLSASGFHAPNIGSSSYMALIEGHKV